MTEIEVVLKGVKLLGIVPPQKQPTEMRLDAFKASSVISVAVVMLLL